MDQFDEKELHLGKDSAGFWKETIVEDIYRNDEHKSRWRLGAQKSRGGLISFITHTVYVAKRLSERIDGVPKMLFVKKKKCPAFKEFK